MKFIALNNQTVAIFVQQYKTAIPYTPINSVLSNFPPIKKFKDIQTINSDIYVLTDSLLL